MAGEPATRPRILVLGGSGAVGAGVVERARELGFEVTAAGRSATPSPSLRERLLDPLGVPYARVDLDGEGAEARLHALLPEHDLVVVACEPWSPAALRGRDPTDGIERLYEAARRAGFLVERNRAAGVRRRRIVRVGSSAAELPHALIDGRGEGWPEDRVSSGALEAFAQSDACFDYPYFRAKLALARAADAALERGVDVVAALPTYVLSAWGDRDRQEPLVQAHRVAKATGVVPSVPLDVIPVSVAATGILLVGLEGAPGERYQLSGVETDTHALHASSLRHLGLRPRPLPVPRRELLDELRLLCGRRRRSPWLDLWLLPWDAWRRAALRRYDVEPWHLAVLLEGSGRGCEKARSLKLSISSHSGGLRLPDEEEIRRRLAAEAQRKIEWLALDGRLADRGVNTLGASART